MRIFLLIFLLFPNFLFAQNLETLLAKIDSVSVWQRENTPPYIFESHVLRILTHPKGKNDSSDVFIRLIESYAFNLNEKGILRKKTIAYGDSKVKTLIDLDFHQNMARAFEYYSRGYIKSASKIRRKIIDETPEQNHLIHTLFLDLDILETSSGAEVEVGASSIKLPFSDKGKLYNYKFEGIKELNGEKVYEISFNPKDADKPLLSGTTFWNTEKMHLRLVRGECNSAVNLPRFVDNVFFELSYFTKGDFVLPCAQKFDAIIKFPFFEDLPIISYKIKATKEASLYNFSFVTPKQAKENFNFTQKVIRLGLGDVGLDFTQKFTQKIMDLSFGEKGKVNFDTLAKKAEKNLVPELTQIPAQLKKLKVKDNQFSFSNPLNSRNFPDYLEYNRVEGAKFGFGANSYGLPFDDFEGFWKVGYGTANKKFSFDLQVKRWIEEELRLAFGIGVYSKLIYEEDIDKRSTLRNSWKTLWFMDDQRDYFRGEGFNLFVQKNYRSRIDFRIDYVSQTERVGKNEEEKVYFALSPFFRVPERENPKIEDGDFRFFKTSIVYTNRDPERLRQSGIRLKGTWEYSNKDFFGSELDYSKFTSEISWLQATLPNQRFVLDAFFGVGKTVLPIQRLFDVGGAFGYLGSADLKEFTGSKVFVANLFYSFGGDIFRLFPFSERVRHSWEFQIFTGAGYTKLREEEKQKILKQNNLTELKYPEVSEPSYKDTDGIYKEFGITLAELTGFIRVDLSVNYDFKGIKPKIESTKIGIGILKF
ncbi:hypothetical protein IT568_07380 [bacterium]|nr:hypothetical protein [bacterium]